MSIYILLNFHIYFFYKSGTIQDRFDMALSNLTGSTVLPPSPQQNSNFNISFIYYLIFIFISSVSRLGQGGTMIYSHGIVRSRGCIHLKAQKIVNFYYLLLCFHKYFYVRRLKQGRTCQSKDI